MRFARLSLHKYGHFDDCDLHFPKGELDFHVVFGTNEAGKSTTLAAAGDLLFGFPHNKAQDFRFDAALLRVGALLEDGQTSLAVQRRRGNQNTVLDEAGTPMQDAQLQTMLRGHSAEAFRTHFSLDHTRLREGGRTMIDARGDLAQTVFAAGSGIVGAQTLLRSLQAEADAAWSPGRTKTSCKQAARDLADADARAKAAVLKPATWEKARDLRDNQATALAALVAERSGHQTDLRALARRRALAAPVQQRATLLAELTGLAAPAFDPAQEALHDETARAIAAADMKRLAAEAAVAEATLARAAIAVDRTILDHREAVDALVAVAGAVREAERDLPGIEADLCEVRDRSDRLIRDLGLAPGPPDTVLDRLPSPAALAGLQARITARQRLDTLLGGLREQLKLDRIAQAEAEAELHALPSTGTSLALAAALRTGQITLAVSARLPERRRDVEAATRALDAALRRLLPWTGGIDALATIRPPAEGDIAASEAGLMAAGNAADDERRALQQKSEDTERLELEMREVAAGRRPVTATALAAMRECRNEAWAPLHAHLTAGTSLADPLGAVRIYTAAVEAADALADERFDTAAHSARLQELGIGLQLARLGMEQARSRLAAAQAVLDRNRDAWTGLLAAAGLHGMTNAAARQWGTDRADALAKAELLFLAENVQSDDVAAVASAFACLTAVLSEHGAPAGEAAPFAAVLDQMQALVDRETAAASQRSASASKLASAQRAVAASERRIGELSGETEAWNAGWEQACMAAGMNLPPESAAALLPLFEQLRGCLGALSTQHGRVAGIARRRIRFESDAVTLAASCGAIEGSLDALALVEQLRRRLAGALSDGRAAQELDDAIAHKRGEYQDAGHSIEAGERLLAPLMRFAAVTDRAGLAGAMQAARTARDIRGRLHVLDEAIIRMGDGHTLEALIEEAHAADPVLLGQETARLQALVDGLDGEIGTAAQSVGEANHAFEALDAGSDDAALAAADREQALATLQAEAEEYLVKRAQVLILSRAVEDYRKCNEDPLLRRASSLFGQLTLGRYSKLDVDRSVEPPRLVGVCPNGRSVVPVQGMSDGTADQLFLALRLAKLEQLLEAGIVLPFLADDLFINFDDQRAHAGFRVLGEVARRTQVLFFSHHNHLRIIAQDALGPHTVPVCELANAA